MKRQNDVIFFKIIWRRPLMRGQEQQQEREIRGTGYEFGK